jgi:Neurotransmitter-gated ion-channel ligand binding domain
MNFMKRRIFRSPGPVFFWVLLVAVEALAPIGAYAAAKPQTIDLRQHPTDTKSPIEIAIGMYITNFAALDENRETFEVGGFVTAEWKDPRLAVTANDSTTPATRSFTKEELWTPSIEGANTVAFKTYQYSLEADKSGKVTYWERFDGTFSSVLQLAKFPFDTQVLRFEFQPFVSTATHIRFATNALPVTGISPEEHTELAAWHLQDLRYSTTTVMSDRLQIPLQEALFELTVKRRSGFYVWKIFLPLLMMTAIPMISFWIDVKEFDWTLKIPMTMLLSTVALEFTVTRDLPRVGYLTFLDAVFLASFAFFFLSAFEIALVYQLHLRGKRPAAMRLHAAGKWGYPLAYALTLAVLAIHFLA